MNFWVIAASPTGDEVLTAAGCRIAELGIVDDENAARLCRIAGLSQYDRSVAGLYQIGVTKRRREVPAALAVSCFYNMDHTCVRIRRPQPIIHKLHGREKRYSNHGEPRTHHKQYPTGRRSHDGIFPRRLGLLMPGQGHSCAPNPLAPPRAAAALAASIIGSNR